MKLEKETIEVLKNFVYVNPSILIKVGSVISTIAIEDNVLANATVPCVFPKEFGIYDLQTFLNTVSLFAEPELDFSNDEFVLIKDMQGKGSCKYRFADKTVIKYPPQNSLELDDPVLNFDIEKDHMVALLKAASTLSLGDVMVHPENNELKITVTDLSVKNGHTFSLVLGEYSGDKDFKLYYKVDNMKFLPGNYSAKVMIGDLSCTHFENLDRDANYWVAMEMNSEFE